MKLLMKKIFLNLFLVILTIGLVVPGNSASAYSEDEINDGKPFMNFYDENGSLIKSYDENEMKEFYVDSDVSANLSPLAAAINQYRFNRTVFSSSVKVNGGNYFKGLDAIVITATNKINKLTIKVYDSSKEVNNVQVGNFTGGLQIPLRNSAMSLTGYYSITLAQGNPDPGAASIDIANGVVFYN